MHLRVCWAPGVSMGLAIHAWVDGAVPRTMSMDSEDNCTFELHKAFSNRSLNWWCLLSSAEKSHPSVSPSHVSWQQGCLKDSKFYKLRKINKLRALFELYTSCSLMLKQDSFCFAFLFCLFLLFYFYLNLHLLNQAWCLPSLSQLSGNQERKTICLRPA